MAEIEFSDPRFAFLKDRIDTLLAGISHNYSEILLAELTRRLEKTLEEFNRDMEVLLDKLKRGSVAPPPTAPPPVLPLESDSEGLSEFEKRLEALDDSE